MVFIVRYLQHMSIFNENLRSVRLEGIVNRRDDPRQLTEINTENQNTLFDDFMRDAAWKVLSVDLY